MNIESKKVTVNQSAASLFHFLKDVKNFEQLMPESISKFEVKEEHPHSQLILGAISDKIPFTLTGNIVSLSEKTSEIQLQFSGEFNAMMAMMIKGPITKFLGTLTDNLATL